MASQLLVGQIGGDDRSVAAAEAQRSFGRLSYLLSNELAEGCTMRLASDPPTTATVLHVLVPVLDDTGEPSYEVLRYHHDAVAKLLLRDGPRILPSALLCLHPANSNTSFQRTFTLANRVRESLSRSANKRSCRKQRNQSAAPPNPNKTQSALMQFSG